MTSKKKNKDSNPKQEKKTASIKNKKQAKIFVLDTNVLLHDHKSIYKFQENDIIIPITTLEEIDLFKKGNEQINYNARTIMRSFDKITGDKLFTNGVALGKDGGKLYVVLGKGLTKEMKDASMADIPDHRILAVALDTQKSFPDREVYLVTKDINLRMKAKAFGMKTEDYLNDKSKSEIGDEGDRIKHLNLSDDIVAKLFENNELTLKDINSKPKLNEYFEIIGENSNALVYYSPITESIKKVKPLKVSGIEARNNEQAYALDALMRKDLSVVALTGRSGTGKTLLALAAALAQSSDYKHTLLARPVIPLQNQDLGFLPGDVNEKLEPYMLPLYDNLSVIKNKTRISQKEYSQIDDMQKSGALQISPLAYLRGRSLSDTFFIVDEAQNLTPHEVKTIITRAGEGTKIVFTGDVFQIDSPYLDARSNGLSYLCEKMFGQSMFAQINLIKGERSKLAEVASRLL